MRERDGEHDLQAHAVQPPAIWSVPPAWMYLPSQGVGIGEDLAPAESSSLVPGRTGDEGRQIAAGATGIRGRGTTPGPRCLPQPSETCRREGGASDTVENMAAVPQTLDTSAQLDRQALNAHRKAEARMIASHASISASLADHAERVARKTARGLRAENQTAADRMAALRRRVSARSAAAGNVARESDGAEENTSCGDGSCRGGGDRGREPLASLGVGLATSAAPTSNEDAKMHYVEGSGSRDGGTAEGAGGGGPDHAANHAAAAWAWHARVHGGAGGNGHHLSAG